MKKIQLTIVALIAFVLLSSHDMFLKLDVYQLQPNTQAVLQLFNGTFNKSDNVIDRNRMLDVSLVGNGKRTAVDSSDWFEKNNITFLNFKTGNAGTWVAGLSTTPSDIALTAEAFNTYLKSDGVRDILENRKQTNTLNKDAVEKYAKHVKTIFQVGDKLSNDWNVNLGYPLEFIPLQNPYELHEGHNLEVRLLFNGAPLKNHFVYVGTNTEAKEEAPTHSHENGEAHSHSHSHDDTETSEHQHPETKQYQTNDDGIVSIDINQSGTWYFRTIKMVESKDEKLTHESNWATLTFGISDGRTVAHNHDQDNSEHAHDHENDQNHDHEHGEATHTHDDDTHSHDEHDDEGFPSYIFWIASFVIIGLLFFWFNKKK
ncbi:DUF4198 domain-containing protein [Winogradskyella schleiferi]|uniref:DUF4198 domain-containing protein n=1 Tax=Winogradskyella schleiferi TaxID=2686078 RepID=UPI0015B9100D|nr:DUF4198 domain-containing protein [Winogradskyella schleiferi]